MYVNATFSICLPSPSPAVSTSLFPKTKPQVLRMNNQWSMKQLLPWYKWLPPPTPLIQSSLGIHGRLGPGPQAGTKFKILKSLKPFISTGSTSSELINHGLKIFRKKKSRKFQKAKPEFAKGWQLQQHLYCFYNYIHTIYTVLGIISNQEMI